MSASAVRTNAPDFSWDIFNISLGLALALVPWAAAHTGLGAWNGGVTGLLLALIGFSSLFVTAPLQRWAALALAGWAVVSPFALGFTADGVVTAAHVVLGVLAAAIAVGGLATDSRAEGYQFRAG